MAVKITTVSEAIEDSGLKVLVYGEAGSGKTVMAATAGVPTLIISAESGLLSIRKAPGYVNVVNVNSMDDIDEVYDFVTGSAEAKKYKWIVLDSVSEMAEMVLAEEHQNAKDGRMAYGELYTRMTEKLKDYRDLKDVNILMTAKQRNFVDDETKIRMFRPDLPGQKLTNSLPYLFDEVFALRVERDDQGKMYRVLQTSSDLNYVAKDRSASLATFEKPNLKLIYNKIHGEAPAKKPPAKKAAPPKNSEEKEAASE